MRKRAKKIIYNPLFSGSAIMIVGSNLSNFIAYLYHLVIGRMLGPISYGELASVISLITMLNVSFSFLGTVIVKFVSSAKEKEYGLLLGWFLKKSLIIGLLSGFTLIVITPLLSDFIKAETRVIILVAPIIFVSVIILVFRSFLQGLTKFGYFILTTNFDMLSRLIFGVLFVSLGLSVFGAVLGILAAIFLALLLARFLLKQYKIEFKSDSFSKGRDIFKYSLPVIVFAVASNSFYSSDLLLVKHFFNPYEAGLYASISTLGKVIFFGTSPIIAVMFPLISKRHAKGLSYNKIFILCLGFVIVGALGMLIVLYLFPTLMIRILFGYKFISGAKYLSLFGIFMSIFSISSLFVSYFLARERTVVAYFVLIAALAQIVGIWFFHETIFQVISVSILCISVLLGILLLYFGYDAKKAVAKAE